MFSDQALLDYLSSLPLPEGHYWLFRQSTTGRGWRLMTTKEPHPNASLEPRLAIEAAILATEEATCLEEQP